MKSGVLETLRPSLVAMEETYLAANPGTAIQRLPPPNSKVAAKSKGFGAPK
jgi:peptide deformylase